MTRQAIVTGIEMSDQNGVVSNQVGLVLRILPDDGKPVVKAPESSIKVSGFKPGDGPLRFGGENCTAVDISESIRIVDPREIVIDLTKLPPDAKYLRIWK